MISQKFYKIVLINSRDVLCWNDEPLNLENGKASLSVSRGEHELNALDQRQPRDRGLPVGAPQPVEDVLLAVVPVHEAGVRPERDEPRVRGHRCQAEVVAHHAAVDSRRDLGKEAAKWGMLSDEEPPATFVFLHLHNRRLKGSGRLVSHF